MAKQASSSRGRHTHLLVWPRTTAAVVRRLLGSAVALLVMVGAQVGMWCGPGLHAHSFLWLPPGTLRLAVQHSECMSA